MNSLGRAAQRCAAGIAVIALLAACGSQVSDERIQAATGTVLSDGTFVPTDGAATGSVDPDTPLESAGSGPLTAPSGASAAPAAKPATGSTVTTAAGGQPAKTGTTQGKATNGAPAACTQKLAPIRLGQTLAASGLVGAAIGNLRQGVALWAKAVNAAGGVQCHPIEVYSMDDGSDSARVASNVNELVKNKKVVALIGTGAVFPDASLKASAEQLKIPVVGGDMISLTWGQSAYMFPQGGGAIAQSAGSLKAAVDSRGGTRAGLLYCVEANICSGIADYWAIETKAAGVAAGLKKPVSLTQSDYTAECQALKNDKVDIIFAGMDGSAITRLARNCATLGLKLPIVVPAIAINPQVAKDPNLTTTGLFVGSPVVPFTTTDTPGAAAFHQALKTFAPGLEPDGAMLLGFAAGKLFEAALKNVTAQARAGDVNTDLVLKGLGLVKNETLGGLAPPLTFKLGQPTTPVPCYFGITYTPSGAKAVTGSKPTCFGDELTASG